MVRRTPFQKGGYRLASCETSRPSEGSASGAIRRVLVVDDSRLQRRILAGSLKKWGFQVIEAESGQKLAEFAAQAAPETASVHAARAFVYQKRRETELSLMAKGIYGAAARDSEDKGQLNTKAQPDS